MKVMSADEAMELISGYKYGQDHVFNDLLASAMSLVEAYKKLVLDYEHSEWLRSRGGITYARVGDEVI